MSPGGVVLGAVFSSRRRFQKRVDVDELIFAATFQQDRMGITWVRLHTEENARAVLIMPHANHIIFFFLDVQ